MSSLNGARMVSPFSSPRLFFFSALFPHALSVSPLFEEIMRQRIRAVSRNSARRGETARSRRESSSTRGYIRLRRFLRSHSYPCGNDKTDGALLLKSHRVSRIRDAEIYESCRLPAFSFSLSPPPPLHLLSLRGRGMIYFERTRIIGGRNVDATF